MKYTAELEKALRDAVIPGDQQEQAAALAKNSRTTEGEPSRWFSYGLFF